MKEIEATGLQPTKSGAVRQLGYRNAEFQEFLAIEVDTDRYLSPSDEDISALNALANTYNLGIVTNVGRLFLANVLRSLGLEEKLFRWIVTSDNVHSPKPSLEPFEVALRMSQLRPALCAYVGDSLEKDLIPAGEAGMKTILFSEREVSRGSEEMCRVASLKALFRLLDEHPNLVWQMSEHDR